MFIIQKTVDRSLLREGFQIPVEYHEDLFACPSGPLRRGDTRHIFIIIDGVKYEAELKNQKFDANKHDKHKDVIQVRYKRNSALSRKFCETFVTSVKYLFTVKQLDDYRDRKCNILSPEVMREYFVLKSTEYPDVFLGECIAHGSLMSKCSSAQAQVVEDDNDQRLMEMYQEIKDLKQTVKQHGDKINTINTSAVIKLEQATIKTDNVSVDGATTFSIRELVLNKQVGKEFLVQAGSTVVNTNSCEQ